MTTYAFEYGNGLQRADAARQRASMKKLREYDNDKGHDDDLLKDLGLKRSPRSRMDREGEEAEMTPEQIKYGLALADDLRRIQNVSVPPGGLIPINTSVEVVVAAQKRLGIGPFRKS